MSDLPRIPRAPRQIFEVVDAGDDRRIDVNEQPGKQCPKLWWFRVQGLGFIGFNEELILRCRSCPKDCSQNFR